MYVILGRFCLFLHNVLKTASIVFQTFSIINPMIDRLAVGSDFSGIQNFFAFFNHQSAIVFSKISNVGLGHWSSQNSRQPLVRILLAHDAAHIELIEMPMCFHPQSPKFPVGQCAHGDSGTRVNPDIGIALRIILADIQHCPIAVVLIDTIGTSENRMTATVRAPGASIRAPLFCCFLIFVS